MKIFTNLCIVLCVLALFVVMTSAGTYVASDDAVNDPLICGNYDATECNQPALVVIGASWVIAAILGVILAIVIAAVRGATGVAWLIVIGVLVVLALL